MTELLILLEILAGQIKIRSVKMYCVLDIYMFKRVVYVSACSWFLKEYLLNLTRHLNTCTQITIFENFQPKTFLLLLFLFSKRFQSISMKLLDFMLDKICKKKKLVFDFFFVSSGPEIIQILCFGLFKNFSQKVNKIEL